MTAIQLEGLRYERRVHTFWQGLAEDFGSPARYLENPWLHTTSADGSVRLETFPLWCQPDGLFLAGRDSDPDPLVAIIESKLSWKKGRADKLLAVYGPLVQALFPRRRMARIVTTKCVAQYEGIVHTDPLKAIESPDPWSMFLMP